jgi:hypothetical protein
MPVYNQPMLSPQKRLSSSWFMILSPRMTGEHILSLLVAGRPTVMQVTRPSITTRQSTSGPLVMSRCSKLAWLKKQLKKLRFSLRDLTQAHKSRKVAASTWRPLLKKSFHQEEAAGRSWHPWFAWVWLYTTQEGRSWRWQCFRRGCQQGWW